MPAAAAVPTVGGVETRVEEVADGIFRLTRHHSRRGTVVGYLVDAEEPLLFGAGTRHTVTGAATALATVMPLERLHWLVLAHGTPAEREAAGLWTGRVPGLAVVHAAVAPTAPPMELGGRRVRLAPTPPDAGWSGAVVLFEEVTATWWGLDAPAGSDARNAPLGGCHAAPPPSG